MPHHSRVFHFRNAAVALLDTLFVALSFVGALILRIGENWAQFAQHYLMFGLLLSVVVAAMVFSITKVYRGMWRYVSMPDVVSICQAAFFIVLLFYPVLFITHRLEMVPRSLPILHAMLLVLMMVTPRVIYRLTQDKRFGLSLTGRSAHSRVPVLLVGAGPLAELFLRETLRDANSAYEVVGVLQADTKRQGQRLHGVPVYGNIRRLSGVLDHLEKNANRPERVILADLELTGSEVRQLVMQAERLDVAIERVPDVKDLKTGKAASVTLEPVAVEDLLGRAPYVLDRMAMQRLIQGKRVLVTGAGGTIGGELARQIADFHPANLVILEQSEFGLYKIEQELSQKHPQLLKSFVLGDVRDAQRLEQLFESNAPEIVFHAAAIKHVPIAEREVEEAVLTNMFGTQNVAEACLNFGVEAMVMISTDKAVSPTNVMGASKRLAERYLIWLSQQEVVQQEGATKFFTVRFGNVLGSTGSVVPLFQQQLERGGPLTVTHPDIKRFFMTVSEAVELVLQAAAYGTQHDTQGENLFVLDMGEQIKIDDLAHQMIKLAGLKEGEDVKIVYTGLRPGEKMYEELFYEVENPRHTECQGIMLATATADKLLDFPEGVVRLQEACYSRDHDTAKALLQELVPEWTPME